MQYQIYWQPQTVLHELQGAIVDFIKENQVHYTNHFLPSGQVIASWTDAANYYRDKTFSDLPRLKPGRTYRATRRVKNSKRMHAYLNWTFFDEKDQIISNQYQNSDFLDLKVPKVYDHYQLDLMSAGTGDFTFYEVTLAEKVAGWLLDQDQQINEHLGAYLDMPKQVVSKTLRVVLAEPELRQTSYVRQAVKASPQAVLYLATDLLHSQNFYDQEVLKVISQAKKTARAKTVEFVGYGLVSSMVALQYRQSVKGSRAIIVNPDQIVLPSGINHYSTDLSDFLSSLPGKIEGLLRADDSLLVNHFLSKNASPIQLNRPRLELLQQLSYPEWPESKQEKAERLQAEREAKKRRKKARQGQKDSLKEPAQGNATTTDSLSADQQENLTEGSKKSLLATETNQTIAPDQPLPPLGPVLAPSDLQSLSEESQEAAFSQLGIAVNQSQIGDQPLDPQAGLSLAASTQAISAAQDDEGKLAKSAGINAEGPASKKDTDKNREQKNALAGGGRQQVEQLATESRKEEPASVTSKTQDQRDKPSLNAETSRQKQLLGFFTKNRT